MDWTFDYRSGYWLAGDNELGIGLVQINGYWRANFVYSGKVVTHYFESIIDFDDAKSAAEKLLNQFEKPKDKFIRLARQAKQIAEDTNTDWEVKFHLIFSDKISRALYALPFDVQYCDPDMDYEDDVRAFVNAYNEKADELEAAS